MVRMSTPAVQPTSAAAYASLQDLGERQTAVLSAIRTLQSACNQKIANYMGIPVNQVTGRVFELRDKGLVKEHRKAIWAPTGRNVIWWEVI